MKTKQTAVQWLEDNLNFEPYDEEEFISNNKIWEQAKQMEKEQIKDAHLIGLISSMEMEATKQAEQYYNETYNVKDN
jgi:hypothetical protein